MGRLFLHIGMGKTATSAIQYFLFKNKEYLKQNNILFPVENSYLENNIDGATFGNADDIIQFILNKEFDKIFIYLENLLSEKDVIISSEVLIYYFGKNIILLKDIVSRFDGKVILYIRKQDEFYNSLINQWTKFKYLSNKDCISEVHEHYFYIMKIINNIDDDKIIMRIYEKEQLKEGNIFADFLNCINLKLDDNYEIPENYINNSLSPLAYEIKRIYNEKYNGILNKKFIESLVKYSNIEKKYINSKFYIISKEEREDLLDIYSVFNMDIANKFFEDKNGELFFDKIKNDDIYYDDYCYLDKDIENAYEFFIKDYGKNEDFIKDIFETIKKERLGGKYV